MRLGEILGLQRNDIDWQTGTLTIKRQVQEVGGKVVICEYTKNAAGMNRLIPLPPRVLGRMREYAMTIGPSLWLFPNKEGKPMIQSNFERSWHSGVTARYEDAKGKLHTKTIVGIRQKANLPSNATLLWMQTSLLFVRLWYSLSGHCGKAHHRRPSKTHNRTHSTQVNTWLRMPQSLTNSLTSSIKYRFKRKQEGHFCSSCCWSRWSGSNRRPAVYKTAALPTELHRHYDIVTWAWPGSQSRNRAALAQSFVGLSSD